MQRQSEIGKKNQQNAKQHLETEFLILKIIKYRKYKKCLMMLV